MIITKVSQSQNLLLIVLQEEQNASAILANPQGAYWTSSPTYENPKKAETQWIP